jgi:hypothetical protein
MDAVLDRDGDNDARCSDKRQHPRTPEGVAKPRGDQQIPMKSSSKPIPNNTKFPGMSPVRITSAAPRTTAESGYTSQQRRG